MQQRRVATEGRLHRDRIKPLEDIADRGMGRSARPFQREAAAQRPAMGIDEGDDAAIGIAITHEGED